MKNKERRLKKKEANRRKNGRERNIRRKKTRHNASASLSSFLSHFFLSARMFPLCLFQILFRIPPLSRNSFISLSRFRDSVLFFLTCSSFSVHQLAYLCFSSSLFLSTLARVIFASSSLRRCTSSLL